MSKYENRKRVTPLIYCYEGDNPKSAATPSYHNRRNSHVHIKSTLSRQKIFFRESSNAKEAKRGDSSSAWQSETLVIASSWSSIIKNKFNILRCCRYSNVGPKATTLKLRA